MSKPYVRRDVTLVQSGYTKSATTTRTNLLAVAQDALGGNFSTFARSFLGESPSATRAALSSLLPVVIGGVARRGASPQGASSLLSLIDDASLDTNSLDNIAGLFSGNGAAMNRLLKQGTNRLVPAVFGDKSGALARALSSTKGIKSSSATSLLAMLVPLFLISLKKYIGTGQHNAAPLAALLCGQGPYLQPAIDARLTKALGFASPAEFLSGLGSATANAAKREATAMTSGAAAAASAGPSSAAVAHTATKSTVTLWLPWLVAAIVLLFLWNSVLRKESMQARIAAAPVTVTLARVYFDTDAAALNAEANKAVAAAADTIKKDNLTVAVNGYTDKTTGVGKNEALAKDRAMAVRDALKAAGVTEASIETRAPLPVELDPSGNDAESHRVDIVQQSSPVSAR